MKRWNPWIGLAVLSVFLGCTGPSHPPDTAKPEEYTLRIVFSGLVALVPSGDPSTPDSLQALVPNLAPETGLAFGAVPHRHINRLLFDPAQVEVDAGDRTVRDDGWVLDCSEDRPWSYITLDSEHLELQGPPSLEMVSGQVFPPMPCVDGTITDNGPCDVDGRTLEDQEKDVQWAIRMDEILPAITKVGHTPPRLRADLVAPEVSGEAGELLAARYQFRSGRFQSRHLFRLGGGCEGAFETFTMAPGNGSVADGLFLKRTMARDLELEVSMSGPIVFDARALDDTDASSRRPRIELRPRPGQKEVTIHIDNHPVASSRAALIEMMEKMLFPKSLNDLHFVSVYSLLDHPEALPTPTLDRPLAPRSATPPSHNIQCSPQVYTEP